MLVMTVVGGVGGLEVVVPQWGWQLFGGGDVGGVVGEGDERDGEYMKYEVEIKRDPWGYAQTYTRSSGSTTLERREDPNDFNLSAPNSHHEDEEVSSDEDVDEWFNAKIGKRMTGQDKEEEEDALIDILKTVVEECKSIYKKAQIKAPYSRTSKIQGISFVAEEEEEDRAGVNVMPKSLFEHLKLADLKETNMEVEMADMTKKTPLGIMENILVKIDKFLFRSDFVVIDMLEGLNETMLLGRPLLATIHAQIDVFRREISLGIGEEKGKFDMNGGICHSRVPVEIFYMASSVQESENFNPLEIENDIFSYDSPACLLLERGQEESGNALKYNGYVFKIMKDKMLGEMVMIFV
ncbi:phospholipase-like protein [Tanacetum coccineum]